MRKRILDKDERMTATITPFRNSSVPPVQVKIDEPVVRPIAVLAAYNVSPNARCGWRSLWDDVALQAMTWPGCRGFKVMTDRNDDMYCLVMSEWDSPAAYNEFARDSRMAAVLRALSPVSLPGECRFLDIGSEDPTWDDGAFER